MFAYAQSLISCSKFPVGIWLVVRENNTKTQSKMPNIYCAQCRSVSTFTVQINAILKLNPMNRSIKRAFHSTTWRFSYINCLSFGHLYLMHTCKMNLKKCIARNANNWKSFCIHLRRHVQVLTLIFRMLVWIQFGRICFFFSFIDLHLNLISTLGRKYLMCLIANSFLKWLEMKRRMITASVR